MDVLPLAMVVSAGALSLFWGRAHRPHPTGPSGIFPLWRLAFSAGPFYRVVSSEMPAAPPNHPTPYHAARERLYGVRFRPRRVRIVWGAVVVDRPEGRTRCGTRR
jgi:hypothetical protein